MRRGRSVTSWARTELELGGSGWGSHPRRGEAVETQMLLEEQPRSSKGVGRMYLKPLSLHILVSWWCFALPGSNRKLADEEPKWGAFWGIELSREGWRTDLGAGLGWGDGKLKHNQQNSETKISIVTCFLTQIFQMYNFVFWTLL